MRLKEHIEKLEQFASEHIKSGEPSQLYQPIQYMFDLGGKRIRPALVLGTAEVLGKHEDPAIMRLALSVEMFHNFTLMHDDIMDNADLRRGKSTVHQKWDTPTAILSGDLLLIQVYGELIEIGGKELISKFNAMARWLCEGQMLDMQFENMDHVSPEQYIEMIGGKTAALLGYCMEASAMISGAEGNFQKTAYDLGINLGLAFQIMDDYLDAFGEKAKVGKQIGGDILEQKKTLLWNDMYSLLPEVRRKEIKALYHSANSQEIIGEIKALMESTGAKERCLNLASEYHQKAQQQLKALKEYGSTETLDELFNLLSARSF
ncbi:polyprenyl synthetase family protein [bacterium]|nr:polyprenyl synthetase family protein [bacterium]